MSSATRAPRVCNLGSINLDHVYRVPHFVRPGETLASTGYHCGAGGKGFNQSIALARAGLDVSHLGAIGADGVGLRDKLAAEGVATHHLHTRSGPTGHAIIQVEPGGQNSIVLHAGANHSIASDWIASALAELSPGDWLLTQNETNAVAETLRAARAAGLKTCLNPAPITPEVADYPLDCVDLLVVNETEGRDLSGATTPDKILDALLSRWPALAIVMTLGAEGARYADRNGRCSVTAQRVTAVDTTAAGDTFLGYFLAGLLHDQTPAEALRRATLASAITVARHGAADSIPSLAEFKQAFERF